MDSVTGQISQDTGTGKGQGVLEPVLCGLTMRYALTAGLDMVRGGMVDPESQHRIKNVTPH